MPGLPELREPIAVKLDASYGVDVRSRVEFTVMLGATEAIFSAVQALVGRATKSSCSIRRTTRMSRRWGWPAARCIRLPLPPPDFRYDWDRIDAAFSARTRLIIFNSPHNPACSGTAEDLTALADLARRRRSVVLSDEVYEHVVFDGRQHHRVLSQPELRRRSVAVFSFGKTLHATGLRVGYASRRRRSRAKCAKCINSIPSPSRPRCNAIAAI